MPPVWRALREAGLRLVTLTNGALAVSQALLERAGVSELFERQLSVEAAGRWNPHPDAYAYGYAVTRCGTDPSVMCLVAVHPRDIDGATRAGMRTGWLNRKGAPYPSVFEAPAVSAPNLPSLVRQLTRDRPAA